MSQGHSVPVRRREELAVATDVDAWRSRSRIMLTPIASPSIMGMFGFMTATALVGAWQAGWYGTATTPQLLWPFTLAAGGILQLARSDRGLSCP